jgi:GNAT superfamily N-acetyltransferase
MASDDVPTVTISRAAAPELRDLRRAVLREGRDEPANSHPADDDESTVHLAARDADGVVVGCVTLVRDARSVDGIDVPVHLVLMAVDPTFQGVGVGALLLTEAQRVCRDRGDGIWAAARVSALGFYERFGFRATGDEFVGAMHLPHRMVVWGT